MATVSLLRRAPGLAAALAALVAPALVHAPAAKAAPVRWCGNDVLQRDRVPDMVAGAQVHVIYAIPADGGDRFPAAAPAIAGDLAAIDAWWRGQDATRTPRFDLFDFPSCATTFGRLDISFARLSQPAAAYDDADAGRTASRIYADLVKRFSARGKKYLVYYDGALPKSDACGIASDEANYAWVFLQPPDGCPAIDLGEGRNSATVAAHELVHGFGALPRGAPHTCPDDDGHPCDDPRDVIYGVPRLDVPLVERLLDPGNDDYYAHAGSWWDVQDSPWLRRLDGPQFRLSVSLTKGGGTVASSVPGIDCPRDCTALLDAGSRVTLEALPATGKRFAGWGGSCARSFVCKVTLDGARSVSARFVDGTTAGPAYGGDANLVRSFTLTRSVVVLGERIPFTMSAVGGGSVMGRVDWRFGDGTRATGPYAWHTYTRRGRFRVTVTVSYEGKRGWASRMLRVVDPAPRVTAFPSASLGGNASLSFIVTDNGPPRRAEVSLLFNDRRVGRRVVRLRGDSSSHTVPWRIQKRRTGSYSWCVRVWDQSGNVSPRSCASVMVI